MNGNGDQGRGAPAPDMGWDDTPEKGVRERLSFGIRWRLWREFGLALISITVILLAGWWLFGGSRVAVAPTAPGALQNTQWTSSERQRLATRKFATAGIPSRGPSPLGITLFRMVPQTNGNGDAEPRRDYDRAVVEMRQWRDNSPIDPATFKIPVMRDSSRMTGSNGWIARLQAVRANMTGDENRATGYHIALVQFWSGAFREARSTLESSGCVGTSSPAKADARGLRVTCLWLRGRIAEAQNPGSGVADLRAALDEALATRAQKEGAVGGQVDARRVFVIEQRHFLIQMDTADLWRDYLSSLLAGKKAQPLDPEADKAVFELEDGDLEGQPEITAMLKMLLVRQGEIARASELRVPAMARKPARQLSGAADVITGRAEASPVAMADPDDDIELQNWAQHNCRRQIALGASGECGNQTDEFKSWEAAWATDLEGLLRHGDSTWAAVVDRVRQGLFALVLLFATWLLFVTARLGWKRNQLYYTKIRSFHFAHSSGRTSAKAMEAHELNAALQRRKDAATEKRAAAKKQKPKAKSKPRVTSKRTPPDA